MARCLISLSFLSTLYRVSVHFTSLASSEGSIIFSTNYSPPFLESNSRHSGGFFFFSRLTANVWNGSLAPFFRMFSSPLHCQFCSPAAFWKSVFHHAVVCLVISNILSLAWFGAERSAAFTQNVFINNGNAWALFWICFYNTWNKICW